MVFWFNFIGSVHAKKNHYIEIEKIMQTISSKLKPA